MRKTTWSKFLTYLVLICFLKCSYLLHLFLYSILLLNYWFDCLTWLKVGQYRTAPISSFHLLETELRTSFLRVPIYCINILNATRSGNWRHKAFDRIWPAVLPKNFRLMVFSPALACWSLKCTFFECRCSSAPFVCSILFWEGTDFELRCVCIRHVQYFPQGFASHLSFEIQLTEISLPCLVSISIL